ncbi:MAG: CARDB domain-containing protein [Pseudomonadota bacterium]
MKVFKTIALCVALCGTILASAFHANAGYNDLPDLVILKADLHPTGACNAVEPAIFGDVVIKNVGSGRAKALVISPLVRVYDDKNRAFKDADIRINSLAPGETTRVKVRIGLFRKKSSFKGWRRLIVKADPYDKIRETNELNNSYPVRIPVSCH